MTGTRDQIVALLRQRPEWTVAELADAVGIAPAALRRHLDSLTVAGTVVYRAVRQPTGRPYYAYRLSEQAREAEAAVNSYPRLLERLVSEVAALDRAETAGKDGQDLLATVFGHLSDQIAADYRDAVRGDSVEERLDSLTTALRREGIVERWEKRDDGFHLLTSACPHRRAAVAASGLCSAEARAIGLLLGTEVEQAGRLVDGAPLCDYLVRGGQPPAER